MTIRFSNVDSDNQSTGSEHNRTCQRFNSYKLERQQHVQKGVRRNSGFLASCHDKHCGRLRAELTAVQVAGDGGMGDEEVVEVGVLLEWRYISSSALP